jgi:hypothetical protein
VRLGRPPWWRSSVAPAAPQANAWHPCAWARPETSVLTFWCPRALPARRQVELALSRCRCPPYHVHSRRPSVPGLVRGLVLSLLAAVAIGHSFTAELQLVASSRGDLVAKREAAIEQHENRREIVKAARAELAALPQARTVAEAQADIAMVVAANPKAGDCRNAAF